MHACGKYAVIIRQKENKENGPLNGPNIGPQRRDALAKVEEGMDRSSAVSVWFGDGQRRMMVDCCMWAFYKYFMMCVLRHDRRRR